MNKINSIDLTSSKAIKLLESYRDKCYVNNVLCQKTSDYYNKIKAVISLPLILSSSVMTILNSSDIDTGDMKIANVILNGTTALLLSLTSNFKIAEKTTAFKSMAVKYMKLTHNIEDKLLYNYDSITKEIVNDIIKEYDNLNESLEYSFPEHIKNKVKEQYRGTKSLPNILNCEGEFSSSNNSPIIRSPSLNEITKLEALKPITGSSILFDDKKTPRVIDIKRVKIEGSDVSV
jgi:hypothetical protein